MKYDLTYKDMTELCFKKLTTYKPDNGTEAQNTWLWYIYETELEEAERLNVLLPLIVWEVKNNMLTPELEDELFLYHEDWKNGKLKKILADYESEIVIADLKQCFQ